VYTTLTKLRLKRGSKDKTLTISDEGFLSLLANPNINIRD